MKKLGVALVALVSLAAAGLYVARRPTAVDVVRARRGPIVETLVASGRVRPASRVELAFETIGTVVSVAVSEGAQVRRGEILVQLDDSSARNAVEQARAQLAQADANVGRLRGLGARLAATDVTSAEIALESARERERRERLLAEGGATTADSVEEATRSRRTAETALARVVEQSRGLGRAGEDVRVALAAREAAQASLRAAQATVDRMALRAPFDGVVLARRVEPGQVVEPGATLLELASSGPFELQMNADESHLARLALEQRAVVSAESFPDRRFDADVARIAPAVDPLRGTVEVRLRVPSPPPFLRPDMTVSIEIETGRATDALVLPASAVRDLGTDRPYVWVVREGVLARREVRLGLRGDERVAIAAGLDDRTDVLAQEPRDLGEGARVRARRGP